MSKLDKRIAVKDGWSDLQIFNYAGRPVPDEYTGICPVTKERKHIPTYNLISLLWVCREQGWDVTIQQLPNGWSKADIRVIENTWYDGYRAEADTPEAALRAAIEKVLRSEGEE